MRVLCRGIDPLRFLAGCRGRLNQVLVVALGFFSLLDRYGMFCVIFFSLWVHALFSSLSFCYQYQRNWLPGKICPQNDPTYYVPTVEWDVKSCSTQLNSRLSYYTCFLSLTWQVCVCVCVCVCDYRSIRWQVSSAVLNGIQRWLLHRLLQCSVCSMLDLALALPSLISFWATIGHLVTCFFTR